MGVDATMGPATEWRPSGDRYVCHFRRCILCASDFNTLGKNSLLSTASQRLFSHQKIISVVCSERFRRCNMKC